MEPTQVRYPTRATVRTAVATAVGFLPILPIIADALGIAAIPWVAAFLAVSASVTRILAHPVIEAWLKQYAPWLAASPRKDLDRVDHHDPAHDDSITDRKARG
ncbi:TPA: hypothetical protein ACGIZG_001594 [Corynebacterium striatum]|nr:hypothetical protein [Corynebacterium striatum]